MWFSASAVSTFGSSHPQRRFVQAGGEARREPAFVGRCRPRRRSRGAGAARGRAGRHRRRRSAGFVVRRPEGSPVAVARRAHQLARARVRRGFQQHPATGGTAAAAVEQAPAFGAGTVSAEHVDVMARGLKDAPQLAHRADRLLVIAQHSNPDEFAKTVAREVRQIRRDDGEQRFLRQRAATRLRTWIDRDSGMFCLAGRFDPLTGAALDRRIRATVEQLFHDRPPEPCPSDPLDKQEFLAAHALKALINGKAGRGAGAAEVIAVVDAREPGPSVVDLGCRSRCRAACCATCSTILTRSSPRWWYATAWCCTHRVGCRSAAPLAWPTGPSGGRCAAFIPRALCQAAQFVPTPARSITSSGGAMAASPTWRT